MHHQLNIVKAGYASPCFFLVRPAGRILIRTLVTPPEPLRRSSKIFNNFKKIIKFILLSLLFFAMLCQIFWLPLFHVVAPASMRALST
jgi:hypothetical protein